MSDPSDSTSLDELDRALDAERGLAATMRAWPTRLRVAVLVTSVGALLIPIFLLRVRPDWDVYPIARMGAELLVLGVTAGAALWLAIRPLHRPQPPAWVQVLVTTLAIATPIAIALLPEAHHAHPSSLLSSTDRVLGRMSSCFLGGLLMASPIWLIGRLLDRRARFSRTGLLAGGLVGILGQQLHCPAVGHAHLLFGHAGIVAFALLVAFGLRAWHLRREPTHADASSKPGPHDER